MDKCEEIENEIYFEYQDKIIPLIVSLEILDNEFPVEILNEIRSIFTHISYYKLNESKADLHLALRHLKRATLDCYKYMCVAIEEKIENFRYDYRNVNLSLADNGNFLPTLNSLHCNAINNIIEAKKFECLLSNNNNEEEIKKLYELYEAAWLSYDELYEFLKISNIAITFASNQSKQADLINNISLIFGFVGIVIGIIGFVI